MILEFTLLFIQNQILEEWQIFLAARELKISTVRTLTIDEIKDQILSTPLANTSCVEENAEPNVGAGIITLLIYWNVILSIYSQEPKLVRTCALRCVKRYHRPLYKKLRLIQALKSVAVK